MAKFDYLIRFKDAQGKVHYGEAGTAGSQSDFVGKSVSVFSGEKPWDDDFKLSGEKATIAEVLSPLATVPIIHGVGLNYSAHAAEGNLKLPPHPIMFVKYPDALADPYEDIPVQSEGWQMDYETELCVIIGKTAKNISATEDPFTYVLGYSVGNDVSARYWQDKTRSSGQHGYAKAWDKFAPLGPVITSKDIIKDPSKLHLETHVNGEKRQESGTDKMIFDVPALLRHMTRGITLRPGTVIMTGTPEGVAAFMRPSPWLKHGDVVECEIGSIGTIRNKFVFEDDSCRPKDDRQPGF